MYIQMLTTTVLPFLDVSFFLASGKKEKIYYQLVLVVEYNDGVKIMCGLDKIAHVFQDKSHQGPDKEPWEAADNAWERMMEGVVAEGHTNEQTDEKNNGKK